MAKYRILLIDDQPLVLSALARYLEQEGYEVHTRSNGEDGVGAAESLDPDVIITDILMPMMDGWEVLKHLRSKPQFALTPIIVLTDLDTSDHRIQGYSCGADDFVSKNTIVEELAVRISRAVERASILKRSVKGESPVSMLGSPAGRESRSEDAGEEEGPGTTEHLELADEWELPSFDQSRMKASRSGEVQNAEAGSGMRGNVDQIGLASILTLLSSGEKTGVLTMTRADGGLNGQIYLREGNILKAEIDDEDELDQMSSFCKIMGWAGAMFSFSRQDVTIDDELNIPTEHLLMEASRILDEA